jgi:WD40 repeat protein
MDHKAPSNNPYYHTLQQIAKEKETTIYCSVFSPEGKYLVSGNNFGVINIWRLDNVLKGGFSGSSMKPNFSFQAHQGSIFALAFVGSRLASTGEGGVIKICDWDKLVSACSQVPTEIRPAAELGASSNAEVNALYFDTQTGLLYSGCGDNNAYSWDLGACSRVGKFAGHTDYIHCLTGRTNGQLVTGSEDGTVRLWDARQHQSVHTMSPYPHEKKWVSCLAVDKTDNWLVCGGGFRCLVVWHLGSNSPTAFMPTSGTPQALTFAPDDTLISVGNERYIYHWEKSGKLIKRTSSNSRSLFSVAVNQPVENRVLAVSGTSPLVDVCTTLGTIAFSLQSTSQVSL